ncbi:recombination protein NinB [Pseudomonas chlororaphis]|uniref:recombination protein NinB n=1 Tax=Pseudomonas chlororaphis TaxID=587753 RepID=UPI001B33B54B|nr:recombination protein NinB [Pseudomonas chlororaphis]MBP5060222.1 recombination protein NinB [Pseudomonas chlororaphis]MBP5143767.1 recombination protein NinB [Pseudomonas chlororaphis]
MSLPSFPLRTEQDRSRAIQILQRVDLTHGITWTMKEEVRSDAKNRRMWAMLRDISKQVEWYGQKLSDEDWKHVFSASVEKQRAVPGLDGGFVVLGVSTRSKPKKWFNDMFMVMEAFGAEHQVRFATADHWGVAA